MYYNHTHYSSGICVHAMMLRRDMGAVTSAMVKYRRKVLIRVEVEGESKRNA